MGVGLQLTVHKLDETNLPGLVRKALDGAGAFKVEHGDCGIGGKHASPGQQLLLMLLIEAHHLSHVAALLVVAAGKKAAFESGHDKIAELSGVQAERVGDQLEFMRYGGVGDEAVVGADRDGEIVLDHAADGVVVDGFEGGYRLQVAGHANFHGDALCRDVLRERFDVGLFVLDQS